MVITNKTEILAVTLSKWGPQKLAQFLIYTISYNYLSMPQKKKKDGGEEAQHVYMHVCMWCIIDNLDNVVL